MTASVMSRVSPVCTGFLTLFFSIEKYFVPTFSCCKTKKWADFRFS
jgi:hypothetical protein